MRGTMSSGDKILCCPHPYAFNPPSCLSALASLSPTMARKPVDKPRMVHCITKNCHKQANGKYVYCTSRTFFVISRNHQSRRSTLNDRSQDVCSYSGCGKERYKSLYGTRYEYCNIRKPLPPSCPQNLPLKRPNIDSPRSQILDCCGVGDCRNQSYKNTSTGTRYRYCRYRTPLPPLFLWSVPDHQIEVFLFRSVLERRLSPARRFYDRSMCST